MIEDHLDRLDEETRKGLMDTIRMGDQCNIDVREDVYKIISNDLFEDTIRMYENKRELSGLISLKALSDTRKAENVMYNMNDDELAEKVNSSRIPLSNVFEFAEKYEDQLHGFVDKYKHFIHKAENYKGKEVLNHIVNMYLAEGLYDLFDSMRKVFGNDDVIRAAGKYEDDSDFIRNITVLTERNGIDEAVYTAKELTKPYFNN